MLQGKLKKYTQKNENGPISYTIHKNTFVTDERHKYENHKILKEKTGSNLLDFGPGNFVANMPLEARKRKAKMNY